VSDKQLAYMIVAASLLIAGIYLFVRRRRFHR
jgi:LPXTG-motif cell wall-anchored protein